MLGDLITGQMGIDVLKIDAELTAPSDRIQGEPARVGHIEAQAVPGLLRQSRLPMWRVTEAQLSWILTEIACKNDPQEPAGGDKLITIPPEEKPARQYTFVVCEYLPEPALTRSCQVQGCAPDVNLVFFQFPHCRA